MKKFKDSHKILNMLKQSLTLVKQQFNEKRYYYISKVKLNFDKNKQDDKLDVNDKVLYYVGERNYPMKKIRSRFTGPFRIIERINNNTVKIYNEETQEEMTTHTQKLKKYHTNQFTEERDYLNQLKQKLKLEKSHIRRKSNKRMKL